jgi:outer membrane protein assembly factor BamB
MAESRRGIAALRWRFWSVSPGSALLLLPFLTLGQAYGHDPGRGPPSDTGPPQAVDPVSHPPPETPATRPEASPPAADRFLSRPAPEEDHWHHNLVRERPIEVRLRTARDELAAGHVTEALLQLQAILDGDEDVFVRLESWNVPSGAQTLADQVLGALAGDAREVYETLHGSEARRLLAAARASGDLGQLTRVVRRFFHTAAGKEAGVLLAHYWLDHGNEDLAAACWQRLLDEPVHRQHLEPAQLAAAAWCFHRRGQHDLARRVTARLAGRPLRIAGRDVPPGEWTGHFQTHRSIGPSEGGAVVCGAPGRNGVLAGSMPAPGRPLWSVSLAGKDSQHVAELAQATEAYFRQNGLPVGAAHFPLLLDDRVVFRDFEGIRAVSLNTGAPLWFYPAASSLSREISGRTGIPSEGNPDPNDQMRFLVGNCLLGMLAADSRRVFAIDRVEADPPPPATGFSSEMPASPRRQSNTLVALAIAPAAGESAESVPALWTIGGPLPREDDSVAPVPLAGHYFFGPPLPLADRLFVVSEFEQQLYLTCLDSASGSHLWSQSLCSVPQPIGTDLHRRELVCSPSYGEGVLVVPTQAGMLIAADPVTGRLLWAASHDDGEPRHRQQMSAYPYSSRRRYGHRGYTNLPVIHEGRVVFLPAHSEFIHCVDLHTGRVHWRVPREDFEWLSATEHIATAEGGTVLLVGRRRCRGLDLETGAERYSLRLGSSPAGRGVRLGTEYHVPLEEGRIIAIDVASGRLGGWSRVADPAVLGNLVAAGERVVSMSRIGLTAWPQAGPELARLRSALEGPDASGETLLAAARLELALGRPAQAHDRLARISRSARKETNAETIRELEREILLTRLADPREDRAALLATLAPLATDPEHRGRYLIERARFEADHDPAALAATARAIAGEKLTTLIAVPDDPSRSVAPGSFVDQLISRLVAPRERGSERGASATESATESAADRAGDWSAESDRLDEARLDEARLDDARRMMEAGRFQEAELALLKCRASVHKQTAAAATRLLAELFERKNLHHDAGRMLAELHSRFAAIEVGAGISGREYVARFPRETPAWEAFRRLSPPLWSGASPRISENPAIREDLQALYNGNGVASLPVPRSLSFDLFDRGRGVTGQLSLVDRQTGVPFAEKIELPGKFSPPGNGPAGSAAHPYVGHFLPLGAPGAVYGLSLLERRLLWTTTPGMLQPSRDNVRVGPTGASFCACQSRQHLFVLDPADGRLLWRRDDLEARSGLMSDSAHGMIGDERVLVVFSGQESNPANYTLYETATGAELRRGRLDLYTRFASESRARRAIGRRLFHVTAGDSGRLRVWDPLTDRFTWDEPADTFAEASPLEGVAPGTKVLTFIPESDEAALVTREARIRVVDLAQGKTQFEVPLDPAQLEGLTSLRAFRDQERYFFNLQRAPAGGKGTPATPTYMVGDAAVPTISLFGDLCAVDRRTHEVLWTASLGNRSMLQLPDFRLPVFITLFRLRKADQTLLGVEVFDVRTGQSLARRDDLTSDRLLQVFYDRQPGTITLRGGKTEIRLEFPADLARLNAADTLP